MMEKDRGLVKMALRIDLSWPVVDHPITEDVDLSKLKAQIAAAQGNSLPVFLVRPPERRSDRSEAIEQSHFAELWGEAILRCYRARPFCRADPMERGHFAELWSEAILLPARARAMEQGHFAERSDFHRLDRQPIVGVVIAALTIRVSIRVKVNASGRSVKVNRAGKVNALLRLTDSLTLTDMVNKKARALTILTRGITLANRLRPSIVATPHQAAGRLQCRALSFPQ